jgi:SAM-dependent methyltransferase
MIKNWRKLPEAAAITHLDDPAATVLHAQIIRRKGFLRRIYREIYRGFKARLPDGGTVVELGSGGGFIKEVIPATITSDVLRVPGLSVCFSALDMPFADESLDALLMIDVLHHLPDVRRFLAEAQRCLKPEGRILMVEPANTLWGRFIYGHFHHEPFEPAAGWTLAAGRPMSSANGALPWIVFGRDRERFQAEFPSLKLLRMRPFMPLRYLISGGVSMRQLLPTAAYPLVKGVELLMSPLNGLCGMSYEISIQKRPSA